MTTVDSLLNAVDVVIAQHGPGGVTLRRVGTAAGLSHTAAAHYFRDKSGLMTAYVTRSYLQIAEQLEAAIAAEPDNRTALIAAGLAYGRFAQQQPAAFSVMSQLELTSVNDPALWEARNRGFSVLRQLVERYQSEGWAPHRSALDLLSTCWAFVHGFVALWVGGPLAAPYDSGNMHSTLESLLGSLLDSLNAVDTQHRQAGSRHSTSS